MRLLAVNNGITFTQPTGKLFLIKKEQGGSDQVSFLDIAGADMVTSAYTTKLFFQSFLVDFSGSAAAPVRNLLPTLAMAILLIDVMAKVWVGTNLLSGILFFIPWGVKTLPFGLVLAGIFTATAAVGSERFTLIRFCGTRWGFDQLFARSPVNPVFDWGRITWAIGDRGIMSPSTLRV
jgi:hypothetical protein